MYGIVFGVETVAGGGYLASLEIGDPTAAPAFAGVDG